MIRSIDVQDPFWAEQIWYLQQLAYLQEIEFIGADKLPPMTETVEMIRNCGQRFLGEVLKEGNLAGCLAYEVVDDSVAIRRVMVHPDCHRRGIATALLRETERLHPDIGRFLVTVGTLNAPAVLLYRKNGYLPYLRREVLPGVELTEYRKTTLDG